MKKVRSYDRKAKKPAVPVAITPVEYGGLQSAYDHFNAELFGNGLPNVLITYQRHAHTRGYFGANRFAGRVEERGTHELALNPDNFLSRSDKEILSTLTHEMCHVWQHEHGKPSKRGYHNKEWAAKMKEVGLYPSNSGMVGGKETGQQMTHYIVAAGSFDRSYERLQAKGWKLNLQSAMRGNDSAARKSKTKFSCPSCGQNAWGKPDLAVTCTPCGINMQSADSEANGEAAEFGSYDQQEEAEQKWETQL